MPGSACRGCCWVEGPSDWAPGPWCLEQNWTRHEKGSEVSICRRQSQPGMGRHPSPQGREMGLLNLKSLGHLLMQMRQGDTVQSDTGLVLQRVKHPPKSLLGFTGGGLRVPSDWLCPCAEEEVSERSWAQRQRKWGS